VTRVHMITDEEACQDEVLNHFFDGCRELIGRVPNSMRVYGRVPISAAWLLPFLVSLQREGAGGRLDGRTKELVVLTTSLTNVCEYCATHNTSLGQATGLDVEQIDALTGDYRGSDLLSDRDKAVVRWAEAVTRNEAARDKAAFEALAEHFDEHEIVEITWLSAMFNMLNRVHDSLLLDIESPEEVAGIQRTAHIPHEAVVSWAAGMVERMQRQLAPETPGADQPPKAAPGRGTETPTVIRPAEFDADTSYEPPLAIGFGIDSATVKRPPAAMGKTVIPPGARNQSHRHENSDACIHVFSGRLKFMFGDPGTDRTEQIVEGGDCVHIPRGQAHGVQNLSDNEEVHLVFCYPGVPDKEAAGTVTLEDLPDQ
jgi:uncharacterized peroxidase-related enzyme